MFITKKSLGQNFLKSRNVLNKIIEAADIKSSDTILEIGPGFGTLTEKLLEEADTVISIEKDRRLIPILQEKFKNQIEKGKLILIEGDILKNSIEYLVSGIEYTQYKIHNTKYKLVANIPYYITGQIFRKFLQDPPAGGQPQKIVLLVQKEIAQRIIGLRNTKNSLGTDTTNVGHTNKINSLGTDTTNIGHANEKNYESTKKSFVDSAVRGSEEPSGSRRDKVRRFGSVIKESILSLSVKAYGEPKIVAKVPASAFSPRPKVDSAILAINNISKKFFTENKINEKQFFEIVKKGFAHKRKTLAKNLGLRDRPYLPGGSVPPKHTLANISAILGNCGLPEKVRAEDLKLNDWICLIKNK